MKFFPRSAMSPLSAARPVAGFTVIEVAFAATVLLLGLASATTLVQSGLRVLDDARNITLASQIMQSELERVRLLPWSSSTGGAEAISTMAEKATVDISSVFSANTAVVSRFALVRTVTATAGRTDTMRDITLTVTWTGVFGSAHSRSFTTRYGKDGLYDYFYTLAH
jgi:Tfp pilus assembly protein PilV